MMIETNPDIVMEDNVMKINWAGVMNLCQNLFHQIKRLDEQYFDAIVPVVRGGMVPATILSHMLDLPVNPIVWQTRDGEHQERKKWHALRGRLLVIDDILDSGLTLSQLYDESDTAYNLTFATLVSNQDAEMTGTLSACDVLSALSIYKNDTPDLWVSFPWERSVS